MELMKFLTARLDEDADWGRRHGCAEDHDGLILNPSCRGRVLADVDAKRRIVAFKRGFVDQLVQITGVQVGAYNAGFQRGIDDVLEQLALPYIEHPDYDEAWRP